MRYCNIIFAIFLYLTSISIVSAHTTPEQELHSLNLSFNIQTGEILEETNMDQVVYMGNYLKQIISLHMILNLLSEPNINHNQLNINIKHTLEQVADNHLLLQDSHPDLQELIHHSLLYPKLETFSTLISSITQTTDNFDMLLENSLKKLGLKNTYSSLNDLVQYSTLKELSIILLSSLEHYNHLFATSSYDEHNITLEDMINMLNSLNKPEILKGSNQNHDDKPNIIFQMHQLEDENILEITTQTVVPTQQTISPLNLNISSE